MDNEIYIASSAGAQIEKMPLSQQERVKKAIDSLRGSGWENSQIVLHDAKPDGGLRAKLVGNIKLLFRYAPQEHAIIVASVSSIYEHEFSMTA